MTGPLRIHIFLNLFLTFVKTCIQTHTHKHTFLFIDKYTFLVEFQSVRADVSEDDAEVIHHNNSNTAKSHGGHGGDSDQPVNFFFSNNFLKTFLSLIWATLWSIKRFTRSSLRWAACRIPPPICVYGHCLLRMLVSFVTDFTKIMTRSILFKELSDVLWTMVFRQALFFDGYMGAIATYGLFMIFATLTLFILVLMEGLSAFLHALRLHW